MTISHNLDLDMSGRGHIFFDKNRTISKSSNRFTHRSVHLGFEITFFFYHAHSFSSTACRSFYQNRKSYGSSSSLGFVNIDNCVIYSGNHWNIVFHNRGFGSQLTSHYFDCPRFWTNKQDFIPFDFSGKFSIFT